MKYPIGIQTFEEIREGGYVYVDKTEHIYNLAHNGKCYFLSRPRRFGKSLLLSTMQAYFEGRRKLFCGLKIDELEKEWISYPVLYIDINSGKYKEQKTLGNILNDILASYESIYGTSPTEVDFNQRFKGIIERAYKQTGHQVVVLVDEYDKPLTDTVVCPEMHEENKSTLNAFYSVLKSMDACLKFVFLTGVTRFGHVSIFSGLNNLEDLSMLPDYIDICGLTEAEIRSNFDSEISELAEMNNMGKAECYAKLEQMYDGYHFYYGTVGIYNPFSVLNTLKNKIFDSYWFATGTPTFLMDLLKQANVELSGLTTNSIKSTQLRSLVNLRNPLPVLYQTGYLTLSKYNPKFKTYTLDYPNEEVQEGFFDNLLPEFTPVDPIGGDSYIERFVDAVNNGDPDDLIKKLADFFASGDYRVQGKMELYFQNSMYVIFKILGFYVDVEMATARGRMDLTVRTDRFIYIFELKLDGSADEALQQIKDKGYADKFAADERQLIMIGINFSSETRTIADYRIKNFSD